MLKWNNFEPRTDQWTKRRADGWTVYQTIIYQTVWIEHFYKRFRKTIQLKNYIVALTDSVRWLKQNKIKSSSTILVFSNTYSFQDLWECSVCPVHCVSYSLFTNVYLHKPVFCTLQAVI